VGGGAASFDGAVGGGDDVAEGGAGEALIFLELALALKGLDGVVGLEDVLDVGLEEPGQEVGEWDGKVLGEGGGRVAAGEEGGEPAGILGGELGRSSGHLPMGKKTAFVRTKPVSALRTCVGAHGISRDFPGFFDWKIFFRAARIFWRA
jgi:hypothetical protein